jgi:hypothetical protein
MNEMNFKLAIYTPINSQYENLDIIYESLTNQTNPLFVWYIIDYNVIESAKSYFLKFEKENKLTINYSHKPFKGRYLATKYAFENIKTPYIVGLDGGYYLVNDGVDTLLNQWNEIENTKSTAIAEIRGLAKNNSGILVGTSNYVYKEDYVDMSWHQMVLKNKNYYEMLASWDRLKFLECINFNQYDLYKNEIDELATSLFWSSLGRKYQTRYLNKILKCKIDSHNSALKSVNLYNTFVSNYYFILENSTYFFNAPKYYSAVIYSFIGAGLKLKLKLNDLLKLSRNVKYRLILVSYYWPVIILKKLKNEK